MTVTAIMRAPKIAEADIQSFAVELLTRCAVPNLIWFAVPGGEHHSAKAGARLKRMGVKPGIADIVIISPENTQYPEYIWPHAYFMELKTKDGSLSRAQRDFRDLCAANGTPYSIARSTEDVMRTLKEWGAIK